MFTGAAYALTLRYCATHLVSVTVVRNYWKFPWLALLRVIAITFVFIVTGLLMTNQNANLDVPFPTSIPNANETDSPMFLAAACFQNNEHTVVDTFKQTTSSASSFFLDTIAESTPRNKIQGWNLYIITLLFYGAATIAESIRFMRRGKSRPGVRANIAKHFRKCCGLGTPLRKVVQNIFLLYLAGGVGLSCATTIISTRYIFSLRQWVNNSGWIEIENNQNPENDAKSFGQLVPIFSSALIVFSFAQIVSEKVTRHNNRKHENEKLPPQTGTIHYLDPSSYDLVPPRVPEKGGYGYKEKEGSRYFQAKATATVTATSTPNLSLPPDVENQSGWGSEMNFSTSHQVATPLLSDNNYFTTVPTHGVREPRKSSSQDGFPFRQETTPPPPLSFPIRPQGHARGASSTSSRSSSSPQSRSLMGSPNVSEESTPRMGGATRFSTRPLTRPS
ncbi:hypothetical protein F5B19DRAFT_476078 [Rostrohypoxylon terebratum]|nr:hypothetical protein F5B19DRAFT_476078 [Rostrohypoxylon terebratum]